MSPSCSANAPMKAAPEAASPAENSAPACCEPTWLWRRSSSGSVITPRPSPTSATSRPTCRLYGIAARSPCVRLRSPYVVTSIGCAGKMPNANAPRADASPCERATVRDGVEIAYVREGEGGYPAAAAARMAGDQAHLVAQHRAARRGGLRGDRPGPARLRRLGPRAGRLLRPRHARARHARAGPRRARPRALRGGGRRRRRGRDPGPRRCASRASSCASACSTRCRRCCPRSTSRPGSRRRSPARCGWRPTTSVARAATPTGSPPSSTRRSKRRRYIAQFYGSRFWAAPGHVHAATTSTS